MMRWSRIALLEVEVGPEAEQHLWVVLLEVVGGQERVCKGQCYV